MLLHSLDFSGDGIGNHVLFDNGIRIQITIHVGPSGILLDLLSHSRVRDVLHQFVFLVLEHDIVVQ